MAYAIPDGRVAMAATTYTGTGVARSVSNAANTVSFAPDFVWIKDRTTAYSHILFDTIRGAGNYLISNGTLVETTDTNYMSAFTSTGFSVGTSAVSNGSAENYVGWQWKAGGTAVSNTAGTITSSVSANPTAGFSVVTYTGTGPAATVGHGLGVAPSFIIIKSRSNSDNWYAYHSSIGNTVSLNPNLSDSAYTNSAYWNNTSPTASVFTIGTIPSQSGWTYVAYCWAPVAGYSAFGSYTGNGSADGPFIYTGFRPRFVMIKGSGVAGAWSITDTSRDTYNLTVNKIEGNTALSEASNAGLYQFDILSNGFKIRQGTGYGINNAATYIYAAFAENPLKYANAR